MVFEVPLTVDLEQKCLVPMDGAERVPYSTGCNRNFMVLGYFL